jgi:DNA repair protein RadC
MYRMPTFRIHLVRDGSTPVEQKPKITEAEDAYKLFLALPEFKFADREHFAVLYLDTKHNVLWADVPFHGTIDATSVFPREIIKAALLSNAAAILVAHNHPTGDIWPSKEDERLTRELHAACKLLDIRLLDHLILGEEGKFKSLRVAGLNLWD